MRRKLWTLLFVSLAVCLAWMTAGCSDSDPSTLVNLGVGPGVQVSTTTLEVTEGGPGAAYAISLNSAPVSDVQLVVNVADGGSQVVVKPDTVTITPTNWDDPISVLILALDDAVIEGPQSFPVTHSFITTDSRYSELSVPVITLEVGDNDQAAIRIDHTELFIVEGGMPALYTISLSAQPNSPVQISFALDPDNGSVETPDSPVTFSVGGWNTPQTISVVAPIDGLNGSSPRPVTISHVVESNDARFHQMAVSDVTVQIGEVGTPYLLVDAGTAEEGDSTLPVTVSLTNPGTDEVSVRVRTVSDTALAESDFLTLDEVVTFQPGGTTTVELAVQLVDDTVIENSESFSIVLTEASGALIGLANTTCRIEDDDLPTLVIVDASGEEDSGSLGFEVVLSEVSTMDVVFQAVTSGASAEENTDFVALNGQFILPAGQTSLTITVELIDDSIIEVDEFLVLQINSVTNAGVEDGSALGTIEDNDGLIVFLDDLEVSEAAGTAGFTLALTSVSDADVTVDLQTQEGTALSGLDFLPLETTVTIPAGETSLRVEVDLVDDDLPEVDETFFLNIVAADGANIIDTNGLVTLASDDFVFLSVNDATMAESAGNGEFTVYLDQPAPWDVRFLAQTLDATATAGLDYQPHNVLHTLAAGETEISIPISVMDDTAPESDETFYLALSGLQGALSGNGTGLGTIEDNDFPALSVNYVVVLEHGSPAVFTFLLDGPSGADVSFMVDTATGTAIEGIDFVGLHQRFHIPAGTTATTVSVEIINDALVENLESFFLEFSEVEHATIGSGAAIGSIVDND
jgi:Calx-beta domain